MSGNKTKAPIDPVEAMKVLRTPAPSREDEIHVSVEDDLTPGALPVVPTVVEPQVFYVVEEDKMVSVRGQMCSWKKGRQIDASSYGDIVINSLIQQGLKMRRVERDG